MKLKEAIEKIGYWELIKHYHLDHYDNIIRDRWVEWHNKTKVSSIYAMLKDKNFSLVSKIALFCYLKRKELNTSNWRVGITTIEKFEEALNNMYVTMWRGGTGNYKENFSKKRFVSFTTERNRADTFSKYGGGVSWGFGDSKKYEVDKYWIVELNIKLNNILLYWHVQDYEVIVSKKDAMKSKIIIQT